MQQNVNIHDWVTLPETKEDLTHFSLEYSGRRLYVIIAKRHYPDPGEDGFYALNTAHEVSMQLERWLESADESIRSCAYVEDNHVCIAGVKLHPEHTNDATVYFNP
tara:strand:+ start:379 stop:696 length:318 start_codon:yes stop_codon:yes gene_type:complete